MVKRFLHEKNIEFEEKDVSTSAEAQKEMMDKSGAMVVPIVDFEGEIMIGFDRPKLEELISERSKI